MVTENTNPAYVPSIGAAGGGSILFSAVQVLTSPQKAQAQANMGLGSAAVMTAAAAASIATSAQLVRGDDSRFLTLASKADLVSGKLTTGQLPIQATMQVMTVANQAARLALTSAQALGQIVKQVDNGLFYALVTGGNPSLLVGWAQLGGSSSGLPAMQPFVQDFLAAATPALARAQILTANTADVAGTAHAAVAGDLLIGNAANAFRIIADLPAAFSAKAPYRAGAGTYYMALTAQADGSVLMGDIAGLTASFSGKADLVSGKVPVGQLPDAALAVSSALTVANQAARLALTSPQAVNHTISQIDDGSAWMLKSGGNPVNALDWIQVGKSKIQIADIEDSGNTGAEIMAASTVLQVKQILELDPLETPVFSGVYVKLGTAQGLAFEVGSPYFWRSLLPPATMAGSSWTLPNRSGFLAISAASDGSLSGNDISGGSPSFASVTVASGGVILQPGSSLKIKYGVYTSTLSSGALTANRAVTWPTASGTLALVTRADGKVDGPVDVIGWAAKADLVSGKVPSSQLPAITLTSSKVVANQAARLALPALDARGFIVVDADTGNSWMLIDAGNPSIALNWIQVGDRSITAAEITNATAAGISLLTAATVAAQLDALAHQARHHKGGVDEIAGERLAISYTPANYVRDASYRGSGIVDELGSHLKGIDGKLSVSNAALQAQVVAMQAQLAAAEAQTAAIEKQVIGIGYAQSISSTTMQDVDSLAFAAIAGKKYYFSFKVVSEVVTLPAVIAYAIVSTAAITELQYTANARSSPALDTTDYQIIEGYVILAAAGDVKLQAALTPGSTGAIDLLPYPLVKYQQVG